MCKVTSCGEIAGNGGIKRRGRGTASLSSAPVSVTAVVAYDEADFEELALDGLAFEALTGPAAVHREPLPASAERPRVEVVRSDRRRRTVSASRQGDRIVVRVPARLPRAEVDRWVATLVERVLAAERRARPSDDELVRRAGELSRRYLGGRARPSAVRWVDNQQRRWGSCTPSDGTIRLSRRLAATPAYVRDFVLLHELTHLLEPDHGPAFKALMTRYPAGERAEAYLAGWSAADAFAGRD